jgi:hypothetical protein
LTYDPSAALNNALTRKQDILVELAAIAGGATPNGVPGSLPNASGGGGIQHDQYVDRLYRELDNLDKLIGRLQGPFEILQQGMT